MAIYSSEYHKIKPSQQLLRGFVVFCSQNRNMNYPTENTGAEFSECGKYRYALWRIWDNALPLVMFIGFNPSTADSLENDNTMKSVIRISKQNGYGGVYMMNLFGIISKDPDIVERDGIDPMGGNLNCHIKVSPLCKDVVFAWGGFKQALLVSGDFEKTYPNALCIGKNKNGSPKHPLYKSGKSVLIRYR